MRPRQQPMQWSELAPRRLLRQPNHCVSDYLSLCLEASHPLPKPTTTSNPTPVRTPLTTINYPTQTQKPSQTQSSVTATTRTISSAPIPTSPEPPITHTPTTIRNPNAPPTPTLIPDCSKDVDLIARSTLPECSAAAGMDKLRIPSAIASWDKIVRSNIYGGLYGTPCYYLTLLMTDAANTCFWSLMRMPGSLDREEFIVYDNATAQTYNGPYAIKMNLFTGAGKALSIDKDLAVVVVNGKASSNPTFSYKIAPQLLEVDHGCLAPATDKALINVVKCNASDISQRWTYHIATNCVSHDATGLCMQAKAPRNTAL
ncbi:Aste57867_15405 [Aphanomyces stellatus]|uniref:Aste57867_15405 protein n=1 Tax=Aphanomyces stellatus TaxID=120398 RepID=A0A485L4W8_9STRA|nr:hypothetical protein As57867_015349 [Aphanomyces stellatus]VFT92208.1 Aste57867_15405 [Aphanomyces stellatus]